MSINKFLLGAIMLSVAISYSNAKEKTKYEYLSVAEVEEQVKKEQGILFPVGRPNTTYEAYFSGPSYLSAISTDNTVHLFNVTFAPSVLNNWHIHKNSSQVLIGVSGLGYYQILGEEPKRIEPGQSVTIPEGVIHWHGAAPNHYFQHLSYMHSADNVRTTWLEPVVLDDLRKLK